MRASHDPDLCLPERSAARLRGRAAAEQRGGPLSSWAQIIAWSGSKGEREYGKGVGDAGGDGRAGRRDAGEMGEGGTREEGGTRFFRLSLHERRFSRAVSQTNHRFFQDHSKGSGLASSSAGSVFVERATYTGEASQVSPLESLHQNASWQFAMVRGAPAIVNDTTSQVAGSVDINKPMVLSNYESQVRVQVL